MLQLISNRKYNGTFFMFLQKNGNKCIPDIIPINKESLVSSESLLEFWKNICSMSVCEKTLLLYEPNGKLREQNERKQQE